MPHAASTQDRPAKAPSKSAAVVDLLNSRHVSVACAKSISLVGRCEYERYAASCKSAGNREGFPINQLDVENGAIDDFLLDQGKGPIQ